MQNFPPRTSHTLISYLSFLSLLPSKPALTALCAASLVHRFAYVQLNCTVKEVHPNVKTPSLTPAKVRSLFDCALCALQMRFSFHFSVSRATGWKRKLVFVYYFRFCFGVRKKALDFRLVVYVYESRRETGRRTAKMLLKTFSENCILLRLGRF